MESRNVVIHMKAFQLYFPLEYVGEILMYDHWNESCSVVFPFGAVYYAVQDGSHVWVCGWKF